MQSNISSINVLDSFGKNGKFIFTLAALFAMLTSLPTLQANWSRLAPFLVVGGLYCFLSVNIFTRVYDHLNRSYRYLYLGGQTLLALLMIWLAQSEGMIGLVIVTLACHAVLLLPLKQAYAFAVCLGIAIGMIHYLSHTASLTTLTEIFAYGAVTAFIIVFMRIKSQEITLRSEIKHLNSQLDEANQKQHDFASQSAKLAIAEKQNNLALDIYDRLGHSLRVMMVQLDVIQQLMEIDPASVGKIVKSTHSQVEKDLQEIQESIAKWRTF